MANSQRIPQQEKSEPHRRFVSAAHSLPDERYPRHQSKEIVLHRPDLGLFAIFDGRAGNEASRKAAAFFGDRLESTLRNGNSGNISVKGWQRVLQDRFLEIRNELGPSKSYDDGKPDATATVAKLVHEGEHAYLVYASVGKARVYATHHSQSLLVQLTEDDDAVRRPFFHKIGRPEQLAIQTFLANAKSEADLRYATPFGTLRSFFDARSLVTQTLRTFDLGRLQIGNAELAPGAVVLLASDGVHHNLAFDEIADVIEHAPTHDNIVATLIEAARTRSQDTAAHIRAEPGDLSAIAIRVA